MSSSRRQNAQSILEFALVLPLFLLFLFGIIDFSRLLFSYVSLADSTREFTRQAVIAVTTSPTRGTSAPVDAFNNFTLIGGAFSPATSVTLSPSSANGSGTVYCNSMGPSGCRLALSGTLSGTAPTQQLNLAMSGASPNSSGSATYRLALNSWNPSAFISTPQTGDFLVVTILSAPDNNNAYAGIVQLCALPLQPSCSLPSQPPDPADSTPPLRDPADGTLQTDLYYAFHFSPLFQNKLAGVIDASLMMPLANVTTSARSYIE
jgi:Flp pilus assembly protein TadG